MKFRIILLVLALVTPAIASALGLGKLELQSALNQPFKARVKLLSPTPDELDSLKVLLADQEAFDRAGIQRTFLLTRLRFAVQESDKGADYIQIRSNDPIREPFLNFLLEINWSKGRLFREYTVLLDPPTYSVPRTKQAVVHPQSPVADIDSSEHQVVYDLEYKAKPEPVVKPSTAPRSTPKDITPAEPTSYQQPSTAYAGSGEYGPTETGDTLWSIASAAAQDSSVSVQQMMLAILQANPEAFIENNINGLKRGAILQIPEVADDALNQAEALAQVRTQHGLWDEYRGHVAAQVTEQPTATVAPTQQSETPATDTDIQTTDESELRLIAEPDQGTGSDQSSASSAVNVESLNRDLALANESIEVLSLENAELKDKLTETEGIIDDLKRLIVLKEDELAAMQEQIMLAAAEQEPSAEVDAEGEVAVEGDEIVDEGMIEEEVVEETTDEVMDEAMDETMTEPEELMVDVIPATEASSDGFFGLMGLLEKAKANLMLVGGVAGGLLLLILLMLFASKRRGEKATAIELPAEDFPDFDDDDETVKAEESEIESESVTVVPGSEEETILPGDGVDDADIDDGAFEIPDVPEDIPAPAAQVAEDDEDPMEEVNVFLAYEHFDEAESFVKNALNKEPDNLYFHSKLLEVFYAAGNKKSYEEAARVIQEKTAGQGEYWEMATVMWQEMSPNRALFAEPLAGEDEEDTASTTGGGVLNIADSDDGSEADEMDFTVDGGDSGEDILDVTAAADIDSLPEAEESGGLDFTVDANEATGLSEDESGELLDDTLQMQPEDVSQVQQNAEEVLDVTQAVDSEEVTSKSVEDELLDFSIADEPGEDEDVEEALDLSLGDSGGDGNELDISFGETSDDGDDDMLDVSIARDDDDSDELDISFGENSDDAGEDILDISVAVDDDDSDDKNEDLLDVTSTVEFESDGDDDLMDVTTATSAGVDASDLMSLDTDEKDTDEKDFGDNSADEEFSLDIDSSDEVDLVLGEGDEEESLDLSLGDANETSEVGVGDANSDDNSFDFDISGDDESEVVDLELDTAEGANEFEIEFDAGEDGSGADTDDAGDSDSYAEETVQMSSVKSDQLDIEDNDEDEDDKTFMVPKSSNVDEQSVDEEMASQLDLAKAYIELGDTENAKTILDEIIAQGNETYCQQAEELIGQIK